MGSFPTAVATGFTTVGGARYVFVGPGDVIVTPAATGISTSTNYGSGNHIFRAIAAAATVTHNGGYLFLDTYPQVRRDPNTSVGVQENWFYIQGSAAGQANMEAQTRVRFMMPMVGSISTRRRIPLTTSHRLISVPVRSGLTISIRAVIGAISIVIGTYLCIQM